MTDKEEEVLGCAKKIKEYCGNFSSAFECKGCIFFQENRTCVLQDGCPEEWELDNTPMKKITDEQKLFLSFLDEKWKYIAKDADGEVWVYEFKPKKSDCCFGSDVGEVKSFEDMLSEDMFDYLYWKDREASLIEDLLKINNV